MGSQTMDLGGSAILAGGISGALSTFAVFPLDSMKLRLQTGSAVSGGLSAYYRGVLPATFGAMPSTALRMFSSDKVKKSCGGRMRRLEENMVAGAVGAVVGALVVVPREVVKQSLQNGTYENTRRAISGIMRTEGLLGFAKGAVPTLLHDIPFFMINSGTFYFLREDLGLPVLPSGILASTAASTLTTPMDVVRAQMLAGNLPSKGGLLATMRHLVQQSGYAGLFRGGRMRLASITPMFTLVWLTYDILRSKIENFKMKPIIAQIRRRNPFLPAHNAAFIKMPVPRRGRAMIC
mmetsp:Transcript_11932/g.49777  ORF Transcript_11932/g.49777 Transcript_11932/m.49777 type:complete len:293 (-) Transcript_11932:1048-1926(-)